MDERKERIRKIVYDLSDYIDDKLIPIARYKYYDYDLEYALDCISTALMEIWNDSLEDAENLIKQQISGEI